MSSVHLSKAKWWYAFRAYIVRRSTAKQQYEYDHISLWYLKHYPLVLTYYISSFLYINQYILLM
jgi:hypothetical protein